MCSQGPLSLAFAVLARLHAVHGAQVMTFPAEPYWGSGSYCLGLGPSDGLQCKSEGLQQMADAAFFLICCLTFLSQAGQKSIWTSGKFLIVGDKSVEILSLMKISFKNTHCRLVFHIYVSLTHSLFHAGTHPGATSAIKTWLWSACPLARAKELLTMYYPDSPAPTPPLTRVSSKLAGNYVEGFLINSLFSAQRRTTTSRTPKWRRAAPRFDWLRRCVINDQVKAHLQAVVGFSTAKRNRDELEKGVAASHETPGLGWILSWLQVKCQLECLLMNDQVTCGCMGVA